MAEEATHSEQNLGQQAASDDDLPDGLKSSITIMMTDMMSAFKQDLLGEFEGYFSSAELEGDMVNNVTPEGHEAPNIANAVDSYINAEAEATTQSSPFADLADEFSTADKAGPAIDGKLASLVGDLCKDQLPKAKLDEVLEKYLRPENCATLVTPRVNKVVWQQLNQAVRTTDNAMQKCQKFLLASVYAILQACEQATREARPPLIHALVLAMAGNQEINLRRRDFLRPHLNSRFSALCNPSTPITTELFGDDINKEIDQLAKSSQLGSKLTPARKSRGTRFHPYPTAQSRPYPRAAASKSTPRRFQAFFGDRGSFRRRSGAPVGAAHSKKPAQ